MLISLNIKVLNSQDKYFQGEKPLSCRHHSCLLLPDKLALLDFLRLVLSSFEIDEGPVNSDPEGSGSAETLVCWERLGTLEQGTDRPLSQGPILPLQVTSLMQELVHTLTGVSFLSIALSDCSTGFSFCAYGMTCPIPDFHRRGNASLPSQVCSLSFCWSYGS